MRSNQIFSALLLACLTIGASSSAFADSTPEPRQVLAPFYTASEFTAPPPGSYALPDLGPAADGELLGTKGQSQHLHDLLGDGKVVLLSFIYSTCTMSTGAPWQPRCCTVLFKSCATIRSLPIVCASSV